MSKQLEIPLTCPECSHTFQANVYRSIWVEYPENLVMILSDKINIVKCPKCHFTAHLPFSLLATNTKKRFAVWYEPEFDPAVQNDAELYAKHHGVDSFYAKAPRIRDWTQFKQLVSTLSEGPDIPATQAELSNLRAGIQSAHKSMPERPSKPATKESLLESLISGLVAKGHRIPTSVSEIPNLPFKNFDLLVSSVKAGNHRLFKPTFNYDATTFDLFSTKKEKLYFNVSNIIMYGIPIISILLAIFQAWPWILLFPIAVYSGWKFGRNTYMNTLFRSAIENEKSFCFLFFSNKIGIASHDFENMFVWKD